MIFLYPHVHYGPRIREGRRRGAQNHRLEKRVDGAGGPGLPKDAPNEVLKARNCCPCGGVKFKLGPSTGQQRLERNWLDSLRLGGTK